MPKCLLVHGLPTPCDACFCDKTQLSLEHRQGPVMERHVCRGFTAGVGISVAKRNGEDAKGCRDVAMKTEPQFVSVENNPIETRD